MAGWLDLASVLNGVAFGLLLFTLAVGLSLVLGTMDVLNLAHGALYLAGSYAAYAVVGERSTSAGRFLAAIAIAAVAGALLGAALAGLLAPVAGRGHLDQALLTLGLALVLGEALVLAFGDDVHAVAAPAPLDASVGLLGERYPAYRLVLILAGLALALVLTLVVERTRAGARVRAVVADPDMAAAVGIDVRAVRTAVLASGALLACAAGALGGPVLGAQPGLDDRVLLLALVVVVIGGLGSIPGTLVAALLIGQIDVLGRAAVPGQASFLLFGVMALTLALRPAGLAAR